MKTYAQIQEKKRERRALFEKTKELSTRAETEKRSLTSEENSHMDNILDQVEAMGKERSSATSGPTAWGKTSARPLMRWPKPATRAWEARGRPLTSSTGPSTPRRSNASYRSAWNGSTPRTARSWRKPSSTSRAET